jgi:YfiH family protein
LDPYAAHLFTTRQWPLGATHDRDRAAAWSDVAQALDIASDRLARVHQVHGASVRVVRRGAPPPSAERLPDADIIVSDDPLVALAIQTADCVPLLIADRRGGAVGAAHAGWRGLAAGVPRAAVTALADVFGSRADDLVAALGPSIGAGKYEVDAPVRDAFDRAGHAAALTTRWFINAERPGHWYFDGWAAAIDQLVAAGVPADQIFAAGLCTASHPDVLCSYRRDGRRTGRMAGAIRLRSGS